MDATLGMRTRRRPPLPSSCLELGLDLSLRSRACGRQDSGSESTGTEPGVFVAPGTLTAGLTSPLQPGPWMLLAATTAETNFPAWGSLSCADSMVHRKAHCGGRGHIHCLMSEP